MALSTLPRPAWGVASIQVKGLPQGLLQRSIDIKLIKEIWTLVVTVERDEVEWTSVMAAFNKTAQVRLDHAGTWVRHELQRLLFRAQHLAEAHQQQSSPPQGTAAREKRGLIDGIGMVAHGLFGLATDDQVRELRKKIEENRQWQRRVSTRTEDYVAVLARTRGDVADNRRIINNLTMEYDMRMSHMQYITTVRTYVHRLEEIQRRQEAIVDDLEHGQLTELILPREDLSSIVDGSLPMGWYYRWCTVEPLEAGSWAFRVRLPIVSEKATLGYELLSYPLWGPSGKPVRLNVARYVALDVASGDVTEPRACSGRGPQVCETGVLTVAGCASAVITSRRVLQQCEVERLNLNGENWFPVSTGEVIVVAAATVQLQQTCEAGGQGGQVTIGRGTHQVRWHAGCRLSSETHSLTSVRITAATRQVNPWTVPMGAVDLVAYFRNRTYPSVLPPIVPLNLAPLADPGNIYWSDGPMEGSMLSALIAIGLLGLVVLYLMYRVHQERVQAWCKRSRQSKKRTDRQWLPTTEGSPRPSAPSPAAQPDEEMPLYPRIAGAAAAATAVVRGGGGLQASVLLPVGLSGNAAGHRAFSSATVVTHGTTIPQGGDLQLGEE